MTLCGKMSVLKIESLIKLADELKILNEPKEKLEILYKQPEIKKFLNIKGLLQTYNSGLNSLCSLVLLSIIAIGQEKILFQDLELNSETFENLRKLIAQLIPIERFYDSIGGIVGYHATVLGLMEDKPHGKCRYLQPDGIDIFEKTALTHKAVRKSLESAGEFAEIYAVGGAGDRLDFRDPITSEPLPAALLPFDSKTLLELLFRDLSAKEYLFYKLFQKVITTKVVLMTSDEKNNHHYILEILKNNNWFNRGKDSFFLFKQPLVPVIDENGNWVKQNKFELLLKPGGHGALWKGAITSGAFDWLQTLGCKFALIRQINNPIAAVDHSTLAFSGIGVMENKSFGFASCPRNAGSSEGMNVLLAEEKKEGTYYTLTNLEYTEFSKKNMPDLPESKTSPYSVYPANTNILFAKLKEVEKAAKENPIPGMLINMKGEALVPCQEGMKKASIGRLESTMQNIADSFEDKQDPLDQSKLRTYLTKNLRRKTISVTKKSFEKSQRLSETKEGCFLDILHNAHDLLVNFCEFKAKPQPSETEYPEKGPSWIFTYHPAFGPLYDIIAQKMQKGIIEEGSELVLEIAEALIQNLHLNGSLCVLGTSVLGEGEKRFSEKVPRCVLKNVTVQNKGIKLLSKIGYPNQDYEKEESLTIKLNGFSEFEAENVVFSGHYFIEVPEGYKVIAFQKEDKVVFKKEKLNAPTWNFRYGFREDNSIELKLELK